MLKSKKCKYCKKLYPENLFGVAKTTPNKIYRRRKCRFCYRDTKQKLIRKNYNWLWDFKKSRGCIKCGITDPIVLDLHHRNESNKSFAVGAFRRSVGTQRMKDEVKKCEVLCANCHRIEHYQRRSKNNIGV